MLRKIEGPLIYGSDEWDRLMWEIANEMLAEAAAKNHPAITAQQKGKQASCLLENEDKGVRFPVKMECE